MLKGEYQVKTANNSFVDAEGSGTSTYYVDRPNAKPAKIVLHHALYVLSCGTKYLLTIIQLMWKGVYMDFKLDGATASCGSVPVYEATLINSRFAIRASTTSASVSKASVPIDHPPSSTASSTREISGAYSNIRHVVDDMNIPVWHARLSVLSLPGIKWLPNRVKGIQLHAKSPLTCTCEAWIMRKIVRKPIQPAENAANSRLVELIHSDVIGPMKTQTMHGYRYIIMFTHDNSRYTEVYSIKEKSESLRNFEECVVKVDM